jgi:protein-disulfide isomerase
LNEYKKRLEQVCDAASKRSKSGFRNLAAEQGKCMSVLKNPVTSDDHILGSPDAPCVLVEYGDYECPHCAAAHPMVQSLEKHFGDRLAFVYRNFPLTRIHPYAQTAAEVAEFAGSKGKFWEMHDQLFENQDRLGDDLFAELVEQLGLDPVEMQTAIENNTFTHRINQEFSGGVRSGVNGTPTFFVQGHRYEGSMDKASLVEAIEKAITGAAR